MKIGFLTVVYIKQVVFAVLHFSVSLVEGMFLFQVDMFFDMIADQYWHTYYYDRAWSQLYTSLAEV